MTDELCWQSAAATNVGPVRAHNEDAFAERTDAHLWAVADGMGGHDCGEVASALIVERLGGSAASGPLATRMAEIAAILREANAALYHMAGEDRVIGSTVAVFVVSGREAACLWAGDSRIYRLRRGALAQLTQDHSYVAGLVASGILTEEQASQHRSANMITRAVGVDAGLEVDTILVPVEADDVFLLCTDGLTCVLREADLIAALEIDDSRAAATALVDTAIARKTRDNVTAVVVRARGRSDPDERIRPVG
jgi:serine/threonine protein phosphatase PrpC